MYIICKNPGQSHTFFALVMLDEVTTFFLPSLVKKITIMTPAALAAILKPSNNGPLGEGRQFLTLDFFIMQCFHYTHKREEGVVPPGKWQCTKLMYPHMANTYQYSIGGENSQITIIMLPLSYHVANVVLRLNHTTCTCMTAHTLSGGSRGGSWCICGWSGCGVRGRGICRHRIPIKNSTVYNHPQRYNMYVAYPCWSTDTYVCCWGS